MYFSWLIFTAEIEAAAPRESVHNLGTTEKRLVHRAGGVVWSNATADFRSAVAHLHSPRIRGESHVTALLLSRHSSPLLTSSLDTRRFPAKLSINHPRSNAALLSSRQHFSRPVLSALALLVQISSGIASGMPSAYGHSHPRRRRS
jgi:hypothetical protein